MGVRTTCPACKRAGARLHALLFVLWLLCAAESLARAPFVSAASAVPAAPSAVLSGGAPLGEPASPVAADTIVSSLKDLDAAWLEQRKARTLHAGTAATAASGRGNSQQSHSPARSTGDYAFYRQYFAPETMDGDNVNHNNEDSGANPRNGARSQPTSRMSITEADVVAATPSLCTARSGCPRSSMVWASGSFTVLELLTPSTFLVEANATLQLSLCCDYKYNGRVLRDEDLYDIFLAELLHASPFHVLSPRDKRHLFPRERAFIVDGKRGRVHNFASELTARDVARHDDGDGDVLVLVTGRLSPQAVKQVYSAVASLPRYTREVVAAATADAPTGTHRRENAPLEDDSTPSSSSASGAAGAAAGEAEGGEAESGARVNVLSADMQLRITNRALKCKCPHTLLVMPLLRLRPDRLPRIHVLGVGPHCGVLPSIRAQHLLASPRGGRTALRLTPHRHLVRIARADRDVDQEEQMTSKHRDASSDGKVVVYDYATTFLVAPALLPATMVTWTIHRRSLASDTQKGDEGNESRVLVLRHTRVLPIAMEYDDVTGQAHLIRSHAPSPYVIVEPHVRYHVHVRAERAGGELVAESEGIFVLRMPFPRSWPLPQLAPQPHFGFHRQLRLHPNETLPHTEVRDALSPLTGYAVGKETVRTRSGGGDRDAEDTTRFNYYGYWENVPLSDQPMPQQYVYRRYNPFADGYGNQPHRRATRDADVLQRPAVSFPLSFGRNRLNYAVRDVDDVCEPVELEEREYWAVQGIITTESPVTACGPTQPVEALLVRHLLHTMRERVQFGVNVPETTWAPIEVAEPGREGNYSCRIRASPERGTGKSTTAAATGKRGAADTLYDGICDVTTTFPGGVSGTTAVLHVQHRSVYDVQWTVSVAVADPRLLVAENMDADYTGVLHINGGATNPSGAQTVGGKERSSSTMMHAAATTPVAIVHVRSHMLHVVRRVSSYPPHVHVQLPMHARRLVVSPPSPITMIASSSSSSTDKNSRRNGGGATAFAEESPTGYWVAHSPLVIRSVDERLNLELDTNNVPNVRRTLPNATLLFVVQDVGEDLLERYGIAYTSRCPDALVEHIISVVAMPAPPIEPAFVPMYTEEDCVVLEPPRSARKDEVVEWRVHDCPEANRAPYVVERVVALDASGHERTVGGGGGEEYDGDNGYYEDHENKEGSEIDGGMRMETQQQHQRRQPSTNTNGLPRTSTTTALQVLACGVEVHTRCEISWTATNLVATVAKTYSLRRCQRPPAVLFHAQGLQRHDQPAIPVFAPLPVVTEAYYEADEKHRYSGNDGGDGVLAWATHFHGRIASSRMTTARGETQPIRRERLRTRTIIPVAGYAADVGYSFNYTAGPQNHFEADMTPIPDEAANELLYTAAHSPYPAFMHAPAADAMASPILWRRRDRYDLSTRVLFDDVPASDWYHAGGEGNRNPGEGVADAPLPFLPSVDALWGEDDGQWSLDDEAEDYHGAASLSHFWESYHQHRLAAAAAAAASEEDDGRSAATPLPSAVYFTMWQAERRRQQWRRRDAALDAAINANFTLQHIVSQRELLFRALGKSSLYPMDYVVRASSRHFPRSTALQEDWVEFQRRGMCVARHGRTALLAVSPLGSVHVDVRQPPPPPPAIAVLPFCSPRLLFSRHPHLHSVYGYDFTWTCEDANVIAVDKAAPTYSVLTHVEELEGADAHGSRGSNSDRDSNRNTDYSPSSPHGRSVSLANARNETNCQLTIHNHITNTVTSDWLLVRRVYPSPPSFRNFVTLSDNAAPMSLDDDDEKERDSSEGRGDVSSSRAHTPTSSPHATDARRSRILTRRVYGKSVVLHVDHPSRPRDAYWEVVSFVPALSPDTAASASAQHVVDAVRFTPLMRHPGALARGRGGSTVLVKGLDTPGLYTIAHVMPDPANPGVCPNVTLIETLEVLHAQVRERELYICGATAALRAVPIPQELADEFIGVWEVVSLQTAENDVWTLGVNFTGIRFEHGRRPDTLVHGLPFGLVTMRWSVYRLRRRGEGTGASIGSTSSDPAGLMPDSAHAAAATTATPARVLVDYDTVRVIVLTENLHSHRLVTLADTADILTTSSTTGWHIAAERYAMDASTGGNMARNGGSPHAGNSRPILREHALLNYSVIAYGNAEDGGDMDPTLLPYYGAYPRPGAGLLTVSGLAVGSLHLGYTLRPSRNAFGPMLGHTCELSGMVEIERVSAFVTAATTLDHECDGYTGEGTVTLCLHARAVSSSGSSSSKASAAAKAASGRANPESEKNSRPSVGGRASGIEKASWESQLRLVDPSAIEEIVKAGAREVADAGCSLPWWVWPTTVWHQVRYTTTEAMAEPGRCVTFTVKAGRHLAPREVSHPLFIATPSLRSRRALKHDGASTGGFGFDRGSTGNGPWSTAGGLGERDRQWVCGQGDFITNLVIDGTGGTAPTVGRGSGSSNSNSNNNPAAESMFSAGFFSRLYRGASSSSSATAGEASSRYSHHHYLPILHADTLQRHTSRGMRPMIGLQGQPDEVTWESSVSRGNEFAVTLRLDLSQPRQLGGYVAHTLFDTLLATPTTTATGAHTDGKMETEMDATTPRSSSVYKSSSSSSTGNRDARVLHASRRSLLLACVEDGAVRAGDVLGFWTEVHRPDGALDRTAEEWIEYVQHVREAKVPCEVLFTSLYYLLAKARRQTGGGGGAGRPLAIAGGDDVAAVPTATAAGERHKKGLTDSDSHQQQLVSLATVEEQLQRIQEAYKWTREGIDVTGLRADLQEALRRRRVTRAQLKEIEEARRARLAQEHAAAATAATATNPESHRSREREKNEHGPAIVTSPRQRLLDTLRLYRSVAAAGGEDREVVAALRIRPPRYEPFVVPYDLLLRTALHKDVMCGTNVSAAQDLTGPFVAVPPPNPYSLVAMSRVAIIDEPAAIAPHAPVMIKQCEVEGHIPMITLNVSGARFAVSSFTADKVLLEEIPNPALPERFRRSTYHHTTRSRRVRGRTGKDEEEEEVGLQPCLADLQAGMEAVVDRTSQKQLHLQLSACPAFRMLAAAEYNEHQDSEELLQRLRYPRLLRVTVRDALASDSFTVSDHDSYRQADTKTSRHLKSTKKNTRASNSHDNEDDEDFIGPVSASMEGVGEAYSPPSSYTATAATGGSNGDMGRYGSGTGVAVVPVRGNISRGHSTSTSGSVATSTPFLVRRTTRDITFVIAVVPTLARLHLRGSPNALDGDSDRYVSKTPTASTNGQPSMPAIAVAGIAPGVLRAFRGNAARPLVLCEREMRAHGFELGIELIGDHWTMPVGEIRADGIDSSEYNDDDDDDDKNGGSVGGERNTRHSHVRGSASGIHGGYQHRSRDRAAANVALLNSFSIVEHHTLDSVHHLFLKGAGVYRSHFIHYLFSTILGDAHVLQSHHFVRRYNQSFVSVAVPPQPMGPKRGGAGTGSVGELVHRQLSSLWLEDADAEAMEAFMGEAVAAVHSGMPAGTTKPVGNREQTSTDADRSRYGAAATDTDAQTSGSTRASPLSTGYELPAVRRFSRVEEILFAVPGIATECRGCLLADTTFFVAGDLTGLWSFPGYLSTASTSAPPSASVVGELPRTLPPLENTLLSWPLVIPWHAAAALPRTWHFHWLCPAGARAALDAFYHVWLSVQSAYEQTVGRSYSQNYNRNKGHNGGRAGALGDATVHLEVVLYAQHDTAGSALPSVRRPVTLLASEPIPLPRILLSSAATGSQAPSAWGSEHSGVRFHVSASAAEAAYTTVAAEYLKYRRPGAAARVRTALAPSFQFLPDMASAGGLTSVNASVFVKVCVPALPGHGVASGTTTSSTTAGTSHRSCTIVSATDTLLTVEAPRPPRRVSRLVGFLRALVGIPGESTQPHHQQRHPPDGVRGFWRDLTRSRGASRAPFSLATLLHHAFLAFLLYVSMPLLLMDTAHRVASEREEEAAREELVGWIGRAQRSLPLSVLLRGGRPSSYSARSHSSGSSRGRRDRGRAYFDDERDHEQAEGGTAEAAAASEARVAFSVMFLVLLVFAYAYAPIAWLALALGLWSYVLYRYPSGPMLMVFVGHVVYWRVLL